MRITKVFDFAYSHQLHNPDWDEEQNNKVFGKCHRLHGHNGKLEVEVEGSINPETGYVMNFSELKEIVKRVVIDKFDHYHANDQMADLTTAENMVELFWDLINHELPLGTSLYRIRLWETDTCYAEKVMGGCGCVH